VIPQAKPLARRQRYAAPLVPLARPVSSSQEIIDMAKVSTYLNFDRRTEEAFLFYRSVFGGEFVGPIHRFGDVPPAPGQPTLAEADRQLVMHSELAILGGHMLMGTDAADSMGLTLIEGNNVHLNLEPDTRAETERLFNALAVGGKVEMPLKDMFWGGYFGNLSDRFGIHWMFNCTAKA
jgi:PhnB protein